MLSLELKDASHEKAADRQDDFDRVPDRSNGLKNGLFAIVLVLGIAERMSRMANLFSIERDWIPTIAYPWGEKGEMDAYDLTYLNAAMSRIDLICKLGSPIVTTGILSSRTPTAVLAALLMFNCLSWFIEVWTARKAYENYPALQKPKVVKAALADSSKAISGEALLDQPKLPSRLWTFWRAIRKGCMEIRAWVLSVYSAVLEYFDTEIWIPSLATSSLHFSIVNFSSTFNVFLLHAGFSLTFITVGEIFSAVFEFSSTIVFPLFVSLLSSGQHNIPILSNDPSSGTPMLPLGSDEDETASLHEGKEDDYSRASVSLGVSRLGALALWQMILCFVSRSAQA